jgi:hypothetical protein
MTNLGATQIRRPDLADEAIGSHRNDSSWRAAGGWATLAQPTQGWEVRPRVDGENGNRSEQVGSAPPAGAQLVRDDETPLELKTAATGGSASSRPVTPSVRVQAAAALYNLTRQEALTEEVWLQTAEVFRRTFRKLRQIEPRHADLAQVVSDALRFTSPDRLSDYQVAMRPLERAGDALLDGFIATETEFEIQQDLLAQGWKLTRPYGGRVSAAG